MVKKTEKQSERNKQITFSTIEIKGTIESAIVELSTESKRTGSGEFEKFIMDSLFTNDTRIQSYLMALYQNENSDISSVLLSIFSLYAHKFNCPDYGGEMADPLAVKLKELVQFVLDLELQSPTSISVKDQIYHHFLSQYDSVCRFLNERTKGAELFYYNHSGQELCKRPFGNRDTVECLLKDYESLKKGDKIWLHDELQYILSNWQLINSFNGLYRMLADIASCSHYINNTANRTKLLRVMQRIYAENKTN